jgi:hypothetical protein
MIKLDLMFCVQNHTSPNQDIFWEWKRTLLKLLHDNEQQPWLSLTNQDLIFTNPQILWPSVPFSLGQCCHYITLLKRTHSTWQNEALTVSLQSNSHNFLPFHNSLDAYYKPIKFNSP